MRREGLLHVPAGGPGRGPRHVRLLHLPPRARLRPPGCRVGDGGLIPLGGCLESTELRNADTFSSLYTLHPQYFSVFRDGRRPFCVFCGRDRTGWPKCAILKLFSCPCCAQKGRAATRLASAVRSGWGCFVVADGWKFQVFTN